MLPVSDAASLNQDLREGKKKKLRGKKEKVPVVVEAAVPGCARGVAGFDICSSQLSARLVFIASAAWTGFSPSGTSLIDFHVCLHRLTSSKAELLPPHEYEDMYLEVAVKHCGFMSRQEAVDS